MPPVAGSSTSPSNPTNTPNFQLRFSGSSIYENSSEPSTSRIHNVVPEISIEGTPSRNTTGIGPRPKKARLPPSSTTDSEVESEWGSNFWVTLVDPAVSEQEDVLHLNIHPFLRVALRSLLVRITEMSPGSLLLVTSCTYLASRIPHVLIFIASGFLQVTRESGGN